MSAAVLGIVYLQMNWIKDSIEESEQKFKKDVFEALGRVVTALEDYEILNIANVYFEKQQQVVGTHYANEEGNGVHYAVKELVTQKYIIPQEELNDLWDPTCPCDKCEAKRKITQQKVEQIINRRTNPNEEIKMRLLQETKPLAERINLAYLDKTLEKELENQGIDAEYNYGVYSSKESNFVIKDNIYLIVDESPNVTNLTGYGNLSQTQYRVNLFPSDNFSPGKLMVYFPTKTRQIWASVWSNLLASLIFISIILFCFIYTIQVVFRQKKVSEMKTDFINNMTHEFKTPIATISLASDSITSPMIIGNQDKVKRFAGIIQQENKRMLSQVEKVLQMALLDKKEFSLKLTPINLHEVIEQAVNHTNLQVEKKGGQVSTNLNAKDPNIEGDLTHISNIVHNLLDNANKYSPEKPEIIVHTKNVANGVQMIVEDHGIGMGKEARKHIFDKFYRVHTGNLHDVKGFGLGLSYVKAMVTAHKGQIDVKSELGKGSSFILFFPFRVDS